MILCIFFVENPQIVETKSKTGKSASPDRQKTPKSDAKSVFSQYSYTIPGFRGITFSHLSFFMRVSAIGEKILHKTDCSINCGRGATIG